MIYKSPRFLSGGDKAIFIEFGDAIDPELNRRVRRMLLAIRNAEIPGLVETVPTYRSLLVHYEPRQISPKELRARLEALEQEAGDSEFPKPKVTEIPTVYGCEYGPDLEFVDEHNGLSPEEVIRTHTGILYLIYMLGFIPGFAYLGGMSPSIATPRLETPRTKIPAGSVGIAGIQTGVYPAESPGGWQLIGRTPIELFNVQKEPPTLLQMGNYVKFVGITEEEFNKIKEQVEQGAYVVREAPVTRKGDNGDI